MEEKRRAHLIFRFPGFTFDPVSGELSGDGGVTRLAPQPAHVLRILLEHAGELVSREYLKERIWPDTIVEFDKGLNFCVREVRVALGDEASAPTFIETLPRRGYRFIPRVEVDAPAAVSSPARTRPSRSSRSSGRSVRVALMSAAVLIPLIGIALITGSGDAREPDPRARESAEMGGYLLTRAEGDDVRRSVDFFQEAIGLDPGYARAHAGLGAAYLRLSRAEEGKAMLRRSLELDPSQWLPHLQLAQRAMYTEYSIEEAEPHFTAALALAPDEVVVQHAYAWMLASIGEVDEALRHMRKALEIDPVSPRVNGDVGRLFYLAGRHDEAVEQCRRTLRLVPEVLRSRDCIVHALVDTGALEVARSEALAAMNEHGAPPEALARVRTASADEGLEAYWRWVAVAIEDLADRGEDSHVHVAAAWARAGLPDRAMQALEDAHAVRCPILLQIHLDPAFATLGDDPRFQALLRRIDLPYDS